MKWCLMIISWVRVVLKKLGFLIFSSDKLEVGIIFLCRFRDGMFIYLGLE